MESSSINLAYNCILNKYSHINHVYSSVRKNQPALPLSCFSSTELTSPTYQALEDAEVDAEIFT